MTYSITDKYRFAEHLIDEAYATIASRPNTTPDQIVRIVEVIIGIVRMYADDGDGTKTQCKRLYDHAIFKIQCLISPSLDESNLADDDGEEV